MAVRVCWLCLLSSSDGLLFDFLVVKKHRAAQSDLGFFVCLRFSLVIETSDTFPRDGNFVVSVCAAINLFVRLFFAL